MCVDPVRASDGNVQPAFVGLGFMRVEFCSSIIDYDGPVAEMRAWRTEDCVLHVQRARTGQEHGTQRELLNSSVIIQKEKKGGQRCRL